jgi:6-phosphogluconolactonase
MSTKQDIRVVVEPTMAQANAMAAEMFKGLVCQAVAERKRCHLALAGGTTPQDLYRQLTRTTAMNEVPWGGVTVFVGDERDVPQDSVESNFGMIQRTLLDHVPVQLENVYPMPADAPDLDAAAAEYEKTLHRVVPSDGGKTPRFDLLLLGMGGDGHTASIFPDTPAESESKRLVMAQFVPVLGRDRMTFTFPLINAARNVLLLVTGEDKADALAALVGEAKPPRLLPVMKVNPTDGTFLVVADADAARKTSHRLE